VSERVALIGLSGAGKTTVAPKVAARLGCDWIDLDLEIARAAGTGAGVGDLIREEGEAAFRAREAEALRQALEVDRRPRLVVACGAGALSLRENLDRLRARAITIWLRVTPGIAAEKPAASSTSNSWVPSARPSTTSSCSRPCSACSCSRPPAS